MSEVISSLANFILFQQANSANRRQLRICIVASSTANSCEKEPFCLTQAAIRSLTQAGHHVTLLWVFSDELNPVIFKRWQSDNLQKLVRLIPLSYQGPSISSLSAAVQSYKVMCWMLENASAFDIVHFPDQQGLAYYTLLAKHQGWAFQQVVFCLEIHSPTLWNKYIHKQGIEQVDDLAADFLERESARLADILVNPPNDVLEWMKKQAWQLPRRLYFLSDASASGESLQARWLNLHDKKNLVPFYPTPAWESQPLVSICLTHFNRPHYLAQALESIRAQDYSHFEVILVDDASTLPEAHAYLDSLKEEFALKGWKIIRNQKNLFPGAARNLAARLSRGEYLMFMDDDNYAKPNELSLFVRVAKQVGADILTCAMDVFEGNDIPSQNVRWIHRFLPLGAAVEVGLYLNMFGDINALIKRQVYEALNGLTEDHGIGGEDWELFARAVLKGYHLETIPMALFWYRDTPRSITKTTHLQANYLRGIRAYLDAVPPALRMNLVLGQIQQDKLHKLLIDHNHLGKLLKRCWQLFASRAWRAMRHPRKSTKKIAKHFFSRLFKSVSLN